MEKINADVKIFGLKVRQLLLFALVAIVFTMHLEILAEVTGANEGTTIMN